MPRCQRTFYYLHAGTVTPGAGVFRWICPHCADQETYTTVRDTDLLSYAALAEAVCIADFGPPQDKGRPFVLLRGVRPECVYESIDKRYDIYLTANSDPWQARLQIGHELFHRVAGEGRLFHWTQEMLACVVSVRLLRRSGLIEYADCTEAQYQTEAELCSVNDLLAADPWADARYPSGYYGRAFVTGLALKKITGWTALCRLARTLSPTTGLPDVTRWLTTLPVAERDATEYLLSGTMLKDMP